MSEDRTTRMIAMALGALALIVLGLNAYSIASEDHSGEGDTAAVHASNQPAGAPSIRGRQ